MEQNREEAMRRINVVRLVLNKEHIPMGHGRPVRDRCIGDEDVLNLKILMETEEFETFLFKC